MRIRFDREEKTPVQCGQPVYLGSLVGANFFKETPWMLCQLSSAVFMTDILLEYAIPKKVRTLPSW